MPAVEASALQGAVRDLRVRRFYEARQWRPAWTNEAEASLNAALAAADRHGLKPDDYRAPLATAREGAAREAALSLAALGYADALARGRTDPTRLHGIYEIPRPEPDLTGGLERVLAGNGDVRAWVEGLAPQDTDYRALSAAYVEAKRQFDAARGRPTTEQSDRLRTLAVNLERRRWLVRTPPRRGSTSTPPRPFWSTGATARRATPAGSWSARPANGRRRASPRRCSSSSPTRPGRCPARSG